MNRAQLIEELANRFEGDKKQATRALDSFVDVVTRAVSSGDRVAISGFGIFERIERPARTARNPRTGASVKIKKTAVPKFRVGQGFKDVVSGAKKLPKLTAGAASTGRAATKAGAAKTATAKPAAAKPAAEKPAAKTAAAKATAARATAAKATGASGGTSAATRTAATKTAAAKPAARTAAAKTTAPGKDSAAKAPEGKKAAAKKKG